MRTSLALLLALSLPAPLARAGGAALRRGRGRARAARDLGLPLRVDRPRRRRVGRRGPQQRDLPAERARPEGGRRFVRLAGGLDPVKPDLTLHADLDEDGAQDALVAWSLDPSKPGWVDPGRRSAIRLLAHDPSSGAACVGSTVHPSAVLPPEAITCAAWLDFDRDGRLDLVVAGSYRGGGRAAGGLPGPALPRARGRGPSRRSRTGPG